MLKKLSVFIVVLFISVSAYAGSQQTSSTLASAIITDARAYLNESTASFWSDAELLQFLNDGMVDIVSRSHCLETTEDINLVADQLEYTITSTYIVVKAVHYVDSDSEIKGLAQRSPNKVGKPEIVDEPKYWYDWAGKIGVYPVLTSVTTEKVTLYLITRPTAIASNANVTTPAIYDKALTLYIVAQAWAKDRQMGKYNQTMALYQAELDRYRQDLLKVSEEPAP